MDTRIMSPISALKASKRQRETAFSSSNKSNGTRSGNGSSSAPLSPKGAAAPSSSPLPSVTLLSVENMPSYSSERSYLLSELEQCVRETIYLEQLESTKNNVKTKELEHSSLLHPRYIVLYLQWEASLGPEDFLQSVLLPSVTRLQDALAAITPQSNETGEESKQSQKQQSLDSLLNLYVVVDRLDILPVGEIDILNGKDENKNSQDDDTSNNNDDEAHFLFHWHQEDLSRSLARQVATHPQLRPMLQGITVGVSNNTRAAPGLDAICTHALPVGSEDRYRQYGSSLDKDAESTGPSGMMTNSSNGETGKTLISIASISSDTLLGWHASADACTNGASAGADSAPVSTPIVATDAPLNQFRVVAEWNAQGNLQSFGQRAHAEWRRCKGLWEQPLCVGPARKPVPRKQLQHPARLLAEQRRNILLASASQSKGDASTTAAPSHSSGDSTNPKDKQIRQGYNPAIMRRRMVELVTDAVVLLLVGIYLWFHFRIDVYVVYATFVETLEHLAHHLRAM
ncbi:hypothetical protein MPSEU_001026400 [Mayamaea pseudoterrestris]|nr:hypothetical protein MPSEU_001026400 [Mayamaea pseudoterrestris]